MSYKLLLCILIYVIFLVTGCCTPFERCIMKYKFTPFRLPRHDNGPYTVFRFENGTERTKARNEECVNKQPHEYSVVIAKEGYEIELSNTLELSLAKYIGEGVNLAGAFKDERVKKIKIEFIAPVVREFSDIEFRRWYKGTHDKECKALMIEDDSIIIQQVLGVKGIKYQFITASGTNMIIDNRLMEKVNGTAEMHRNYIGQKIMDIVVSDPKDKIYIGYTASTAKRLLGIDVSTVDFAGFKVESHPSSLEDSPAAIVGFKVKSHPSSLEDSVADVTVVRPINKSTLGSMEDGATDFVSYKVVCPSNTGDGTADIASYKVAWPINKSTLGSMEDGVANIADVMVVRPINKSILGSMEDGAVGFTGFKVKSYPSSTEDSVADVMVVRPINKSTLGGMEDGATDVVSYKVVCPTNKTTEKVNGLAKMRHQGLFVGALNGSVLCYSLSIPGHTESMRYGDADIVGGWIVGDVDVVGGWIEDVILEKLTPEEVEKLREASLQ